MIPAAEPSRAQLVTFQLERHAFAVQVEQVWRVEALADFQITRVPGAASFLEGLINLRGRIIPVIDLKKRLGLAADAVYSARARLLIVEMETGAQTDEKVAMIVDTVNDIRWFVSANLRPAPPMVAEISSEYLSGILEEDGRLWIVLDLRQVLSTDERRSLRNQVDEGQDRGLPAAGETPLERR